jgi:hypothetical protein
MTSLINKRVIVKKVKEDNNYDWNLVHMGGLIKHNIGKITTEGVSRVSVEFKTKFDEGHDCKGTIQPGHGRFIEKEKLMIEGIDTMETFINEIKTYLPPKIKEEDLIL